MTNMLIEWLLRPDTLSWVSAAFLVSWAARPIAEYLDREVPLEGEISFDQDR